MSETKSNKKKVKKVKIKNDIVDDKTNNEIENDVAKIFFPSYVCPDNINVSNAIMRCFHWNGGFVLNDGVVNFTNKIIPFMYSEFLQVQNPALPLGQQGNDVTLKNYRLDIENKMRYALDIPKKLKYLDDLMEVIDWPGQNVVNGIANRFNPPNENAWKYTLPRYKKYKRLENMYRIVVEFALNLIHNFFWYDFLKFADPVQQNSAMGVYNLDHYTEKIMPIVIRLMKELEDQVNEEFPPDLLDWVIRDVKP